MGCFEEMRRGFPAFHKSSRVYVCQYVAEEAANSIKEPTMEYKMDPNRQPRFIIRSCFGGSSAAFVASGSEVSWPLSGYLRGLRGLGCVLCVSCGYASAAGTMAQRSTLAQGEYFVGAWWLQ